MVINILIKTSIHDSVEHYLCHNVFSKESINAFNLVKFDNVLQMLKSSDDKKKFLQCALVLISEK